MQKRLVPGYKSFITRVLCDLAGIIYAISLGHYLPSCIIHIYKCLLTQGGVIADDNFHAYMQMNVVDIVNLQQDPIPFHVWVRWIGGDGEKLQQLAYKTEIIGAKMHYITLVSPDKCIGVFKSYVVIKSFYQIQQDCWSLCYTIMQILISKKYTYAQRYAKLCLLPKCPYLMMYQFMYNVSMHICTLKHSYCKHILMYYFIQRAIKVYYSQQYSWDKPSHTQWTLLVATSLLMYLLAL